MPNHRALSPERAKRAAELYVDGKSIVQIGLILRASDTAVKTALKHEGVEMRDALFASVNTVAARTGFRRKSQLVSSVFQLGA